MTKSKVWVTATAVVCSLFLTPSFLYAATDTTVKGTTSDNSAAALEATNSSNTSLLFVRNDGNVGIGTATPGALLHIKAGSSSLAPLMLSSQTLETTAEDGAVEMDADVFYGTNDAGNRGYIPTKQFIRVDSGTARTLPNDTATNPVFGSPTNGRITLETGTYVFEFLYNITGMSGTSGNAQILFGGGGTFSEWNWYLNGIDNSTLTTLLDDDSAYFTTNASAASCVTAVTGTALRVHGRGTFTCTAAGTFIPQIDLVTAAAATVQPGSYFMVERIGSTSVISVGQWD